MIKDEVKAAFKAHDWPGSIPKLQNFCVKLKPADAQMPALTGGGSLRADTNVEGTRTDTDA